MSALHQVVDWPVDHVAAAIITDSGVDHVGELDRRYELASLSKPITAWAIMVAVEEGVIDLDRPLRHVDAPAGATMRHLLSHAAGFGFDGDQPIAEIERTRTYSNTGIERAADELAAESTLPFEVYLDEAVLASLGMTSTTLDGSPAHGITSTLTDTIAFASELRRPTLLARTTVDEMIRPQYPTLGGIVPGVGRFDRCPWGLGVELHGDKSPHWMGRANSAATFGHFGGAGTMMWVDPLADVAVVALTDRRFEQWSDQALQLWPEFSDAALAEARSAA
ncbi:MAG: serine hydrolase domain-containing protein [Ilumatobacteraceae bacterium]|nr:serine hydrolase domain-containing protein [Ilumatobacteraceae bacterium]